MLLTIHNLPNSILYTDVKALLHSKCGINEVILDNLVSVGNTKKVTVGLADEGDAAILVRKINGLYLGGQQLYVEDVRQKKASEQPYRSKDLLSFMKNTQVDPRDKILPHDYQHDTWEKFQTTDRIQQCNIIPRDSFEQPDNTQQRHVFQKSDYQSTQPYVDTKQIVTAEPMAAMMNYNIAPMYYVPDVAKQNTFLDYGGQAQQDAPTMIPRYQEARVQQKSFGIGGERSGASVQENRPREWGHDTNRLYWDRERQSSPKRGHVPVEEFSSRRDSRWDNPTVPREARRLSRSPQRAQFNSREPFFVQNLNPDAFQERIRDRDFSQRIPNSGSSKGFQGRSERFNSRSGQVDYLPSSNIYGSHVTEPPARAPVWDDRHDKRNQREHPSTFQKRDDPNSQRRADPSNVFQPRSERRSPRFDPESFQFRNSNRSASRPVDNRQNTNATRGPTTKRFADRRAERDEPQPKRFAAPKPRDFPKPWKQSPLNSNNLSSRPVKGRKERSSALPPKPGPPRVDPSASQTRTGQNKAGPPYHQLKWNQQVDSRQQPLKQKLVTVLRRDQTWRCQAAAQITKDILKNLEITDMGQKDEIVARMKSTIRSRIEVMMADQLSVPLMELIQRYRSKYPPDSDNIFFVAILDDIKSCVNKESDDTNKKESDVTAEKTTDTQNINANGQPKAKDSKAVKLKLPKSIKEDINAYNGMTKKEKLQVAEDLMVYQLPPELQKALDDECDVLCDLFMSECEVPDAKEEKTICERISDQAADDFRKSVRLYVTKRLLNFTTDLQVRIHCRGKEPDPNLIAAFLKKYGVSTVQRENTDQKVKSQRGRHCVALCDSYKIYDTLCALGSFEVDGVTWKILPMCETGPPKLTKAQLSAALIQGPIDHSESKLLEKPGQKLEKPGHKLEEPGQKLEEPGQKLEKPGQKLEEPGEELMEPERELVTDDDQYADGDEIDQDLEDVVKEYANLDNDYIPENEDSEDGACDNVKDELFEVDENDLEDY